MRALAIVLAAVGLAAAACDSGSDTAADNQPGPQQDTTPRQNVTGHRFRKNELPQIVLQPSDAPPGMRYEKRESGAKTLDDLGFFLQDDLDEIHALRIRGIRDAIFDSNDGRRRLASRFWLFAQPRGAVAWLEKSRGDAVASALQPVESPELADDSWAARGNLNGLDVLTYAFRAGNIVAVVSMLAPEPTAGSDSTALAAAQKAADRLLRS